MNDNDTLEDAHRRVASLTAHDITPTRRRTEISGYWYGAVAFVVVIVLLAVIVQLSHRTEHTRSFADQIETTARTCNIDAGDGTITLNTAGNDTIGGDPIADLACVLTELGATDALIARIDKTTAMNGLQSDTIGRVRVSWSYHPDAGLFLAVEPVPS